MNRRRQDAAEKANTAAATLLSALSQNPETTVRLIEEAELPTILFTQDWCWCLVLERVCYSLSLA